MRNLEAKFRLSDLASTLERAEAMGFALRAVFSQRDTFFNVSFGKLKMREQPDGASLIHYRREHSQNLELSNYEIIPIADPRPMRAILNGALGVLAEVVKERMVLMRRNIRLHLDRVDNLGEFAEIEAVLGDGDTADSYRLEIAGILSRLEIREPDLIAVSYFELMRRV
jgi:predicted adenylyl cyclase CyaB